MIPLTNSEKREFDTQLFRGISCLLTKIKDKLTTVRLKKDSLYAVFLSSIRAGKREDCIKSARVTKTLIKKRLMFFFVGKLSSNRI